MKSNWKEERLGSLVRFSSGGTPNKNNPSYWNGTIPWISAKNMKSEVIETSDLSITEEGLIHGSKIAPKGSLLLLVRGSGLFNGIPVCYLENAVAYNQDVKCIESTSELENKYLFYWLKANSGYLRKKIEFTSIGAGKFDTRFLSNLVVRFPDKVTRKKIIDIADNISDRININRKINENLAQQAQAIYADIFITNADPAWPLGHLSDLITVRYGKDHKKLNDGPFPVYGSGGVMRYVERPIYEKESVLIPRKGTLNNVMYVNEPFWSVDTMFFTEMKLPDVAKFVFHFVKSKDLASLNAGSAVPSMTTDILNAMELSIPDAETLKRFESIVGPMYRAMQHNSEESKKLAAVRDSLLPRLMSGELDVSELDL